MREKPPGRLDPITFELQRPTSHAFLVIGVGFGTPNVPTTENFKPRNTEWATPDHFEQAGWVVSEWRELAVAALQAAGTALSDEQLTALRSRFPEWLLADAVARARRNVSRETSASTEED